MDKVVIMGIDPGLSGAMAVVGCHNGHYEAMARPFSKIDYGWRKGINVKEVYSFYRDFECDIVLIEEISPRAGEGVVTAATSGRNFGEILGVLQPLDAHVISVRAGTWKSELGLTGQDKMASVNFCQEHYPQTSLKRSMRCRNLDHNMADAICIAHTGMQYIRRVESGHYSKPNATLNQFINYWTKVYATR